MPKIYTEHYIDEKNGFLRFYELSCKICGKRVICQEEIYDPKE
jgi:hypothetical protein